MTESWEWIDGALCAVDPARSGRDDFVTRIVATGDEHEPDSVVVIDEAARRLIEAAPGLLAALIVARPLIDVTHPDAAEVHRVVEDALRKATEL